MTKKQQPVHLERALWPEVVFAADLALMLHLTEPEALEMLNAGRAGPFFEVKGVPAVLRRDLVETLTLHSASPRPLKEIVG